MIAWWLVLAGCAASGPDPDTVLSNLRVISVVADPPEVAPGDRVDVTIEVFDPQGGDIDVMGWFCTPLGGSALTGGCAEAGPLPRSLSSFTMVAPGAGASTTASFVVPLELAALVPAVATADDLIRPVFWGLACRAGTCPLVGDVLSDPAPGSASWLDTVTQLGRPTLWLPDLAIEDSSLATRLLLFSSSAPADRNANPKLEAVSVPAEAAPGELVSMSFLSEDVILYPFASAGGFLQASYGAARGFAIPVGWEAPKETGVVQLMVVAEDQLGGSAVWRGSITVR